MSVEGVDVVGSPGWWMDRLSRRMSANRTRFDKLEKYWIGKPPMSYGNEVEQTAFHDFMRTGVTNFASLIASAPIDQIELRSVMTAVDNDPEGDQKAWQYVTATNFDLVLLDAGLLAKKFGWSYLATLPPIDKSGFPVVVAEDPRLMAHESHPVDPTRLKAVFKIFYDSSAGLDVATLWLPGETWVATRPRKMPIQTQKRSDNETGSPQPPKVGLFSADQFTMMPMRSTVKNPEPDGYYSERYSSGDLPIELIENPGSVGEYELHLPLMDRINHGILNRLVIATLQAFKQKALVTSDENAPEIESEDEEGNPVNLDNMFAADPGALWILPKGRTLWESGQVDLSGILSSVKDDVLHLAAVSKTPMSMFTPDAVSNSAEGVQLTRDSLTNKVRRFQVVLGRAGARSISRAFRYMGDEQRGDASKMSLVFFPPQRYSLAEQGQAASQAGDSLTWEQKQDIIWQRTPQEIAQARTQRMQDVMFQQVAAAAAAGQPGPSGTTPAPAAPTTVTSEISAGSSVDNAS